MCEKCRKRKKYVDAQNSEIMKKIRLKDEYPWFSGIDSMLRMPNCPFVLFVGTKKLVKRKEFEQVISEKLII